MEERPRILVVEDETAICRGLCDALEFHRYVAVGVDSGEEGLRRALEERFAVVLLDVMLPGLSGLDVCRELRERRPEQAILMLTARGSESDVLEGFRRGADDYVTKPFSVAQLMARVQALVRRAGFLPGRQSKPFDCGPWRVDPVARRASRGQTTVDLSSREVALLALFTHERGRVLGRRRLLADVWGMNRADQVLTRTVDMHIVKLRRKLAVETPNAIETVRGEGYRLTF